MKTVLGIDRTALLNLFAELKLQGPNAKWENARLLMKAKKLPSLLGSAEPELSAAAKDLLDSIKGATANGDTFEVQGEMADEPKPAAAKGKKTAKAHAESNGKDHGKASKGKAGKGKGKAEAKTGRESKRTPSEGVDEFGNRIGSELALVNKTVGKKGLTMAEICAAVKAREGKTFYAHCNAMVAAGHFTKEEGKYRRA